jgi:hypothetical protein
MTAILAEKSVPELEHSSGGIHALVGADSTQFFKGALVGTDAAGKLINAVAGVGCLQVVGVCQETFLTGVGNTRKITFNSGIFQVVGSVAFALADLGEIAHILDNQTVSKTATNNAPAGTVYQVDSANVLWIQINYPKPANVALVAS